MKIGYARVSTTKQRFDLQYQALEDAGCDTIFTDRARRTGLSRALRTCRSGDVLVVWKIDRLGRKLAELIDIVETLNERGIGLHILTGAGATIDISRPEGRMVFGLCAVVAEFEHELIRERICAGMAAARERGVKVDRPFKSTARRDRQG